MADRIFINDSAVLEASIAFDEVDIQPVVVSTDWQVVRPDSTNLIVSALPTSPTVNQKVIVSQQVPNVPSGLIAAFTLVQWNGTTWTTLVSPGFYSLHDDLDAMLTIVEAAIDQTGLWRARCRFHIDDNTTRSSLVSFEVLDPLAAIAQPTDNSLAWVLDHTWMKIEDLFDSELGGPWLRDKTRASFTKDKMALLVPDALYYINNDSQPVTTFDDTTFPMAQHKSLLAQGLLVETIYHLIRSYVEQPQPLGQPITYFDRRDYLQRWSQVLQSEEKKLQTLIDIFKLQYMNFGSSALLVGGYASSLMRTPAAYRTRYPKYVTPYRAIY